MEPILSNDISALMYPLLLKRLSSKIEIDPFIPVFAYRVPSDEVDVVKDLYLFQCDQSDGTYVLEQPNDAGSAECFGLSGKRMDGNASTVNIPGHLFATGDTVYAVGDTVLTLSVEGVMGDFVTFDTDVPNDDYMFSLNPPAQDGGKSSSIVFVGVSAPIMLEQYRLYENILAVPLILEGKARILMPLDTLKSFRVGDSVYIETESIEDAVHVTLSRKRGAFIGVFTGISSTEPPLGDICLKRSLFSVGV